MIEWLLTNALAALALACVAGVFIWTFRPAPAVRHALWLVVVLKLVAPGGPTVSLPIRVAQPTAEKAVAAAPGEDFVVEEERFTIWVEPKPGQTAEDAAVLAMRHQDADEATDAPAPPVTPVVVTDPPARPIDYRPWLLAAWVAGALLVAGRQLRETFRFARFVRQSRPAPESLVSEVESVASRLGVRLPAVRTLAGLTSPVLWCLGRPVLLWPAGLECRLKGDGRRAVIAHELAHLRRRDHWVRRLEMVASVLHWWNPLFWVARKKLRADAELACDAWAAGQADRRAYAEALLEVCSFNPRRRPAPAVGVFGEGRRAMQERLTMIMRDHVPCRLAFGAKLVVALMTIAAVPAWTLGQQGKPEVGIDRQFYWVEVNDRADGDDAQTKEIENQIKALAQKLAALKSAKAAEAQKSAADAQKRAVEKLKEAQGGERTKELRVQVETKDGQLPQAAGSGPVRIMIAGQDGVKVIGPDGKEIKDVKVIIGGQPATGPQPKGQPEAFKYWTELHQVGQPFGVRVAPEHIERTVTARALPAGGEAGMSITLSRATYKLNKDQATALGTLLGSIKATVMETKVDGDSITVTTTPEAQAAIGQIIRLIQGQGGNVQYRVRLAQPGVPATPAVPVPPVPVKPPASPAKPGAPAGPEKVNVNRILDQLKAAGVADKVDVQGIIEKALKDAGTEKGNLDMSKLHGLLQGAKPLELKLKVEKPDGEKKPDAEKK